MKPEPNAKAEPAPSAELLPDFPLLDSDIRGGIVLSNGMFVTIYRMQMNYIHMANHHCGGAPLVHAAVLCMMACKINGQRSDLAKWLSLHPEDFRKVVDKMMSYKR